MWLVVGLLVFSRDSCSRMVHNFVRRMMISIHLIMLISSWIKADRNSDRSPCQNSSSHFSSELNIALLITHYNFILILSFFDRRFKLFVFLISSDCNGDFAIVSNKCRKLRRSQAQQTVTVSHCLNSSQIIQLWSDRSKDCKTQGVIVHTLCHCYIKFHQQKGDCVLVLLDRFHSSKNI